MDGNFEIEVVDTRYGRLAFFANDTIIGRSLRMYGEWAEREIRFLQTLIGTGATVVDVGGYIGTHTLAFSHFVGPEGRVVALEPQHESFELLQRNVRENQCSNVRLENAAAADRLGEMEIAATDFLAAQNFGGLTLLSGSATSANDSGEIGEGEPHVGRVRLLTIDSLELEQCALLKIDVEGAEHLVIRGARETIKRCSPFIYAECNSLERGLETIADLRALNYSVLIHVVDAFNEENLLHAKENMFGASREVAIVGVPPGVAEPRAFEHTVRQMLLPVETADDLALCMFQKPQYLEEVLQITAAAREVTERYSQMPEPMRTIAEKTQQAAKANAERDWHIDERNALTTRFNEKIERANQVIDRISQRYAALNRRVSSVQKAKRALLKVAALRKGVSPRALDAILTSVFFEADYYFDANPKLNAAGENAALHYLRTGAAQGRDPGPFFSSSEYVARNRDIAESGANALAHYEMFGRTEGRNLINLQSQGDAVNIAPAHLMQSRAPSGDGADDRSVRRTALAPDRDEAIKESQTRNQANALELKLAGARKILVIIPLYKNAGLISDLIQSIADCDAEFAPLDIKFLFINDSPEDAELRAALEIHLARLPRSCNATLWVNESNAGFIGSCNRGLELALAERRDAILLNSDALLTPGAISEMSAVADEDPLIGFVSPRSNNATICNSPYPDRYRSLGIEAAIAAHRFIERFLPRMTYVPTAVGFCLYIRHLMLAEFGLLDSVYGQGYNEENDFIMRCNRRGYRAVLANRAFVYHLGKVSFSLTDLRPGKREDENRKVLLQRYPEFDRAVERYFNGVDFKAQSLVAGFIPDRYGRRRVLFECSQFGLFHSGTTEFAKKMIAAFCEAYAQQYACSVSCSPEVFKFHGLHQIPRLDYAGQNQQLGQVAPFAAAIRLAQPFSLSDLTLLGRLAPLSGFVMLDTIAMDCLGLDTPDLGVVWGQMPKVAGLIGYNSEFSRDQFRRRFDIPSDVVEFMAFHSVAVTDYLNGSDKDSHNSLENLANSTKFSHSSYVLIVGNHYSHKNVVETLALFRDIDNRPPIVVLGLEIDDEVVTSSYQAGVLNEELVESLYANANVVLFPSHYEGFGFPIMHALKYRKPVVARDLPSAREIKGKAVGSANIHLFATTADMVRFASSAPNWLEGGPVRRGPAHDWRACAVALEEGLSKAIDQFQFATLRSRLMNLELLDREERRSSELSRKTATEPPAVKRNPISALLRLRRFASAGRTG